MVAVTVTNRLPPLDRPGRLNVAKSGEIGKKSDKEIFFYSGDGHVEVFSLAGISGYFCFLYALCPESVNEVFAVMKDHVV
ncbi:MAG TPA: hypothetical protein H9768_06050 [Candidatus Mailhella merdavium]|nr:hypothetical protein [Candidatus Mailhella merdavium]